MKAKNFLLFVSFIALFIFLATLTFFPTFEDTKKIALGSDKFLLDEKGQIIQQTRTDFKKRRVSWLPLSSFPKDFQDTLVKVEDKRFFSHMGVDFIALARAFYSLAFQNKLQGASTLSMQLSDLISSEVLLHNKRIRKGVLLKKVNQLYFGFLIDLKWSKKQILEAYLNLIHLKGEFQGVPSFSQAYLQKSPQSLNSKESLIISSLIREPNSNKEKLFKRVCTNASRIKSNINCDELRPLINHIYSSHPSIKHDYNSAFHLSRKLFREKPKKTFIHSYIDSNLQEEVYSILYKNLLNLQKNRVRDISALVIENKSGKVLSYIGSVSEFSQADQVDGANSPRQAGSTLKPFLYARALEQKFVTPASIIKDDSTVLSWAGGLYRPQNYDKKFHGNVTLRQALASSLNVPAVKIVKMLGLQETYSVIKSLGFSDLKNNDFYGASMALGAAEVRLHELANAYRAIANKGELTPLKWYKNEEPSLATSKKIIMAPETAFLIKSILSDSNARSIGFGWNSALETSFWTAVKTGTSKGLRDNWCVGFSSEYTVAVWTGNFSSETMSSVSGVSGAAPSWHEIMGVLHRNTRSHAPEKPHNITALDINFDWKVGSQTEYFIKGTEPLEQKVDLSNEVNVSITFPAQGSTLALNPHKKSQSSALFVRFKGKPPEKSSLYLNGIFQGKLKNPFKISKITRGRYTVSIKDSQDKILDHVKFQVK